MPEMIRGIYRDRLLAPDGAVLRDSGWRPNMIVLPCRVLLAAFLRNDNALGIPLAPGGARGMRPGTPVPSRRPTRRRPTRWWTPRPT